MFDHITIKTLEYDRSRDFYTIALEPLGYSILMGDDAFSGFGKERPQFWIARADEDFPATSGVHIAFLVPDRKTVHAFYEAALAAGGKDNGAPGIRSEYSEDYYGAFVLDPDGNNIEAVTYHN